MGADREIWGYRDRGIKRKLACRYGERDIGIERRRNRETWG